MHPDNHYMREALALAARGVGATRPNPAVGAVIVDTQGSMIGRGWHRRAGEPHAEVEALRDAAANGHAVRGATMFVTLEPCNHTGRTGPCSRAVVEAGIRRVVIAARDPNPVAGGGIETLRAAGIEVTDGVLAVESRLMNAGFFVSHLLGRPLVTLKWAMTLDGCTSTVSGDSKWITGEAARAEVHRRRAAHDAVLAGIETVLRDNARLTIRGVEIPPGIALWRLVLDSNLRLPPDAPFLDPDPHSRPLVACAEDADTSREKALAERGAEVVRLPRDAHGISLTALMKELHVRRIQSVYTEGGRRVAGALLEAQLADRVEAWIAPRVLGGGSTPLGPIQPPSALPTMDAASTLLLPTLQRFGNDWMIEGWHSGGAADSLMGES